jgi:phosphate acetyltransferase
MSAAAALANGVDSKIAGNADVLIVPSLEAGALMLRTLTGMFGALAAGIVLGAKVPIVLAARGDSMEIRMAGCVLASLVAQIPKAAVAPIAEAAVRVAA